MRLFRPSAPRYLVPNAITYHQQFLSRTPVHVLQPLILSQRASSTTCQPPSQLPHENSPVKTNGKKSLAWRQLHDWAPASYGVHSFDGYFELVPRNTSLPCKKSRTMESAFDYIRSASFEVCRRRTMLDVPLEIAEPAYLEKVRLGKKGEAKFKVTMEIGKDLIGQFTAQDTWTKYKVSSSFDGGRLLHAHAPDKNLVSGHPT